ncbi:MAG: hypothetical protein V4616_10165, partial [Bacteroidota bacterium]
MKKRTLFIIIGAVLLILIVVAIVKGGGKSDETRVTATIAQPASITEIVTANGKIQPAQDVKAWASVKEGLR